MSMTDPGSCIECGAMSLPTVWPLTDAAGLCDTCATRLGWHLAEAKALGDLVGLSLEQLRAAVTK